MDKGDPIPGTFPPDNPELLALRREGYSDTAIGQLTGRSERAVEFILEEFDRLMAKLPYILLRILLIRLEGDTNAQIAHKIGQVERSVELKVKLIRAILRPDV